MTRGVRSSMRCSIVAIDYRGLRARIDTCFGLDVAGKRMVTIKMIRRNVKNSRRSQLQRLGGFELKTRQLEYVKLRVISEQIQRRRTQVAADRHADARRPSHLANQRRHRT